ncbi:YjhX family toxin [Sphingomonas sp. MMSM20]|uniref:YjhX family toxin n=1 Tax=Sphingomonas lycopersici TaxID=2951807 RepID=UPI0022381F49|nr:YjhX family toxin [Sphingomonas lycopersici]MCW6533070.1 YjhX family toxin [Sphingomonas lycopersici]
MRFRRAVDLPAARNAQSLHWRGRRRRDLFSMNISKAEQRVLHALAQGGRIVHRRDEITRDITNVDCFTREGWRLSNCTLAIFHSLRRKRLIASKSGAAYRITYQGLRWLNGQADNR